jgi:hypothetical protein
MLDCTRWTLTHRLVGVGALDDALGLAPPLTLASMTASRVAVVVVAEADDEPVRVGDGDAD